MADAALRIIQTCPAVPLNKDMKMDNTLEPGVDRSAICKNIKAVPHMKIDAEHRQSTNTNIFKGLNLTLSMELA
jgi:hypothetical protein